MKRNVEFTCKNCFNTFTRPKNRLNNNRINPEKLKFCNNCYKVCVICGERHGKNGDTCSKECSKQLRENTNIEKYGVSHNWGGNHPGRETYKKTMLKKYGVEHNFQNGDLRDKQNKNILSKYGVENVFQLDQIKEKIKETNLIRYGVENPKQNDIIIKKAIKTFYTNLPKIRKKNEEKGLWIPLDKLSEMEIYNRNVTAFTNESIRLFGEKVLSITSFDMGQGKGKYTIDHMFSKKEGFIQNIPPQIIGSIVNLEILEHSLNSSKGSDCSISKELLYNKYNNLQNIIKKVSNENKINKES